MENLGKLIGFVIFIAAAVGIYFLVRGKGRRENLGAWSTLEQHFRVEAMPALYTTTSGLIGLGEYRNTLQLALDSAGVYLNLPALTRTGSHPLLIPYGEFKQSAQNPTVSRGAFNYTQFLVRGQSVCLDPDDAKKILARQ